MENRKVLLSILVDFPNAKRILLGILNTLLSIKQLEFLVFRGPKRH